MTKILVIYYKCSQLEVLNLSSFNNANSLKELDWMFEKCNIKVELITLNNAINAKKYEEWYRVYAEKAQEQELQNQEQNNENQ